MCSNLVINDKNDNPYTIVCRESDGYIDVTNLYKAGGRKFHTWNRRSKTKEFLNILGERIKSEYQENNAVQKRVVLLESEYQSNRTVQFCTVLLIKGEYQTDMLTQNCASILIKLEQPTKTTKCIWVHPKVAINIAQWVSPKFDVQVSEWVHQLLVLGQVKITDEHNNGEIKGLCTVKRFNLLKILHLENNTIISR